MNAMTTMYPTLTTLNKGVDEHMLWLERTDGYNFTVDDKQVLAHALQADSERQTGSRRVRMVISD